MTRHNYQHRKIFFPSIMLGVWKEKNETEYIISFHKKKKNSLLRQKNKPHTCEIITGHATEVIAMWIIAI